MPRTALVARASLFFAVFALAAQAYAGPPRLSSDDWEDLRDGDPVVRELKPTGGNGVAAMAVGLIHAPPAKVWPVIQDCSQYHKFMPRTAKSQIKGQIPGGHLCFIEIEMPLAFDNLWSLVEAKNKANPDGTFRRQWNLKKGTYKRNKGSWDLYPHANGTKTLLVYTIDVNPNVSLPDWVLASAQTGALPDLFEAIGDRVKKLR